MIGHLNPAIPLLNAAVIILAEIPAAVQISCCHTLIPMGAVYFLLALSVPGNVSSREGEGRLFWADYPVSCPGAGCLSSDASHCLGSRLRHPRVRGRQEGLGLGA